jgi:archaeosine-15-forming tRNA-guanine transglycosylase
MDENMQFVDEVVVVKDEDELLSSVPFQTLRPFTLVVLVRLNRPKCEQLRC